MNDLVDRIDNGDHGVRVGYGVRREQRDINPEPLFDSDFHLFRHSNRMFPHKLIEKSTIFVIKAVTIRLPLIRLSAVPPRSLQLTLPLNLATAPVIVVFLLKASKCIPWTVIADGITGGDSGIQPYNIMILFFSLAYLAMSLGTNPATEMVC